jgi:uncharacterized membrane protein
MNGGGPVTEGLVSPMHLVLLGPVLLFYGLLLALVVVVIALLVKMSRQGDAAVGLENRFRRLVQLNQEGLITDDEYHAKREELMKHL